jgi:hypothetical protein
MRRSFRIRRVAVATIGALAVVLAVLWYYGILAPIMPHKPANSIMVIAPYRFNGTWVFDDPRAGLVREPFVGGVPEMIDTLVADIPNADKGFRLTFSAREFPGYQKKLTWVRGDALGNWYRLDGTSEEGWLCPALFKYYHEAPRELYIRADPKG